MPEMVAVFASAAGGATDRFREEPIQSPDIDYPLVNMNPLHGGAIVRAASWPALARRCLHSPARPEAAHDAAAPRQTATRAARRFPR
jgi:hypothetical protein